MPPRIQNSTMSRESPRAAARVPGSRRMPTPTVPPNTIAKPKPSPRIRVNGRAAWLMDRSSMKESRRAACARAASTASGALRFQQSRTGTLFAQPILGVAQGTGFERQAAATDTPGEAVTQPDHPLDPLVQPPLPHGRELAPVRRRRRASVRQSRQRITDRRQRDADALRDLDYRHQPQDL